MPGGYRADVPAPYSAMPFLVPRVDADGNDTGRHPTSDRVGAAGNADRLAVPQRTIGAPSTLIAMAGAYIEFPKTKADRERTKDPRLSIAERYGTRAEYVKRVHDAAAKLAEQRFILSEDVEPIANELAKQWDAIMGASAAKTSSR